MVYTTPVYRKHKGGPVSVGLVRPILNELDTHKEIAWLIEIRAELQEWVEVGDIGKNQYRREKRLCDLLIGALKRALEDDERSNKY